MPEVHRWEEVAVGMRVLSMTCMFEEPTVSGKTESVTPSKVEVDVVLADRRGPSPSDRDIAEGAVATPDVSVFPMTSVDAAAGEPNVTVLVEVHVIVQVDVPAVGTLTSVVVPPRTDTTAGVDQVPKDVSLDADKAGYPSSASLS